MTESGRTRSESHGTEKSEKKQETQQSQEQAADHLNALRQALATPPPAIKPSHVLTLQRTIGNRAVQSLLARRNRSKQLSRHTQPVVQRDPPDEPRLAPLSARRDPLNRRRLVFSDPVTPQRAVRHVWPNGFRPNVMVFHPDHNDPWANRERNTYQRYIFDYGNPVGRPTWREMWSGMSPEVRSQYGGQYQEQEELGRRPDVTFPAWMPEALRTHIMVSNTTGNHGIQAQTWPDPRAVVWIRVSPSGDINYAVQCLLPTSLRILMRSTHGDRGQAQLLQRTFSEWNQGMRRYVVTQHMHPQRARQRLREEANNRLVIEILNALSMVIPERLPALAVGAGRRVLAALRGESRAAGEAVETAASDLGHAPTLPGTPATAEALGHAPTLPASSAAAEALGHAPTVPPGHAPTLPASASAAHAPTLPASSSAAHAPTVPPSHAPTIPAGQGAAAHAATVPPGHAPTLPASSSAAHAPTLPASSSPAHAPTLPASQSAAHAPTVPASQGAAHAPGTAAHSGGGAAAHMGMPPGGSVTPMTTQQRASLFQGTGRTRFTTHNYAGSVGRANYEAEWAALGMQGPPPPHGFLVRDAQGQVVGSVAYWERGMPLPGRTGSAAAGTGSHAATMPRPIHASEVAGHAPTMPASSSPAHAPTMPASQSAAHAPTVPASQGAAHAPTVPASQSAGHAPTMPAAAASPFHIPPGGDVAPLSSAQRQSHYAGGGTRGNHFDGASGRELYEAEWRALGQSGPPPPNGFMIRNAEGEPVRVVGFWEHGLGRTTGRAGEEASHALSAPGASPGTGAASGASSGAAEALDAPAANMEPAPGREGTLAGRLASPGNQQDEGQH